MKKLILNWVILILLILSVNHTAYANVVVQTDKEQYTTGDDVVVNVRNELTEPIYYLGMCSLSDCLQEGDQWECEESLCDAPRQVLLAGEEKAFNITVIGLIVGDMRYRFEYTTAILEQHQETYSNPFFIISTGGSKDMTLSQQVERFPISKRSQSPRIYRPNSATRDRKDNGYIARNFKNQDAPSNQEIIRQRKRQDRASSQASSFGLAENEVILSVSGVPKKMRRSLINVLTGEFPFIRSMEEVAFFKGVVQYFVELDVNPEEFADRLDITHFATFQLDIIRLNPNHIDCVLKFK